MTALFDRLAGKGWAHRRLRGDRVTQASPRAPIFVGSRPSVSTALRGHGWLGPILTTAILALFLFAMPALFGGL